MTEIMMEVRQYTKDGLSLSQHPDIKDALGLRPKLSEFYDGNFHLS